MYMHASVFHASYVMLRADVISEVFSNCMVFKVCFNVVLLMFRGRFGRSQASDSALFLLGQLKI